ncbi:MAG: carboxypeptidase-like regulatory domain-containing protein, partial [Nannocystaceae bacterium]
AHATLVVRVYFDNGVPQPRAGVFLDRDGATLAVARTLEDGEAWFRGLEPGEQVVRVDGSTIAEHRVTLTLGETTLLEVTTAVPGPPPPEGIIAVTVRRHTGTIAGDGIPVRLLTETGADVDQQVTRKGKVELGPQRFGDYAIMIGDGPPSGVTLDRKRRKVTVALPRPLGSVAVSLVVGKAPGVGYAVELRHKGALVQTQLTDDEGVARFVAEVGWYQAAVGDRSRAVLVAEGEQQVHTLELADKDAPPPEYGTLAVRVTEDGEPVFGAYVSVLGMDGGFVDGAVTEPEGEVSFELPPGEYRVEAEDQSRLERVDAAEETTVDVALSGRG